MQLNTVRDIQQALAALKLPTMDQETIASIGRFAGNEFKKALVALSENHQNSAALEYVSATLSAARPATRQMFNKIGYEAPSAEALHSIFLQEGRSLRVAVGQMLREPTSELETYITSTFGHLDLEPTGNNSPDPMQTLPEPTNQKPQRNLPQPTQGRPTPQSNEKPDIESTHIYGGRCAFCFTKDKARSGGMPTITIDSAPNAPGKEKTYNWKEKLAFQLTPSELPLVFGVLYGFIDSLELAGHGAANDKTLQIERQGPKYFFSMRGEGKMHPMPAPAKDLFRVMAMMLEQMKATYPNLDTQAIVALSKRVCEIHATQPIQRKAA